MPQAWEDRGGSTATAVTNPFPLPLPTGIVPVAWDWRTALTSPRMAALLKLDLPFFLVLEGLTHGFWHCKAAPEKVSPINGSNPGLFLLVTPAGCLEEADCLAMVFWHILCPEKKDLLQVSPWHRQGAAWDGAVRAWGHGYGFSWRWYILMRSQQAGEHGDHPSEPLWSDWSILISSGLFLACWGRALARSVHEWSREPPCWARCPHPVPASRHAGAHGRPGWCSWMWRELMEHQPEAALISTEARGGGRMPGDRCGLSPARERCRESIQAPGRASRHCRPPPLPSPLPPGRGSIRSTAAGPCGGGCSAPGAAGMARGLSGAQGGISAEPAAKGLVLGWEVKRPKQFGEITLFSPSFCFFLFGLEF